MINIIQHAKYQPGSNVTSIAFTLGSSPTPGNILIAFCGYSAYTGDRTITPPSGDWTEIDKTYNGNAGLGVYWYEVQEGDGVNFTFDVSGDADTHSGVIYEINDVDLDNPINKHSIVTTGSQTTITTSEVTPSVLNTLALSASATNAGSGNSLVCNSVSSGHTLDQSAIPVYHSTFGSHKDDLTDDLVTAISNTFTFSNDSGSAVASMLLLNPSGTGGGGIDEYTKLMLHCNGSDGSTTFTDDSDSAHTVTAVADAKLIVYDKKFGTASLSLDGDGDYITSADSPDWDFGSDDFTIDCWVKFNDLGSNTICARTSGGSSYFYLTFENGTNLRFRDYGDGGSIDFIRSVTVTTGAWYHVAVVRSGNNFQLFLDGVQQGATYTNSASMVDRTVALDIGHMTQNTGYALDGLIDEFRWSKGIARWTSNFTPPTEEYTVFSQSVDIEETVTLNDDWSIITPGIEEVNIDETINIDDDWNIQSNPELTNILETLSLDDEWSITETTRYATKIISYNPLIYVTNTNPAKIVQVDISNPSLPISNVYTIISNSYAKDVVYNSENDYFYVICADGKVVKINKNDLEDQTIIDTLDNDTLINVDAIDDSFLTYSSTDDVNGEIIMLDEREVKKINLDLRWSQVIQKIISIQLNTILGKLVNLDLRWKATVSKIVKLDLRWLKQSYEDIFKFPISYTDWEVYINGVELTTIDDVDMNSILITHDITQEEQKASQVQFILNRRHDKLNYTNTDVASEITNNNTVIIKIKGNTEFTGKIANLTCNSETETVNVIAIGTRPSDKRQTVNIPMSSLNEDLHLYHCLVNNINIDNPYIDPDDENPEYYKGIQVDLGTEIRQNILKYTSFYNTTTLAEKIENGEFNPKQNWSYFWFAKFENFVTGRIQATLSYLGTSLGSLSTDTWKINGVSYKYQKELEDIETELGVYQVGEAPYDEISVKNGIKITKDKWVDKNDGLYRVKDEGYDYTEYAKRIADLEYQKLLNINGQILPRASVDIMLSVDAYYYYNIGLLTRINVTNTTTSGIYNNTNGFPVAVKNIRIQCSTEGENSMIVTLTCDNSKSQLELEEIDEQYPDEESDEFIFAEELEKQNSKFDPNTWSYLV